MALIEIDGLPNLKIVIFHSYVTVYQRVYYRNCIEMHRSEIRCIRIFPDDSPEIKHHSFIHNSINLIPTKVGYNRKHIIIDASPVIPSLLRPIIS